MEGIFCRIQQKDDDCKSIEQHQQKQQHNGEPLPKQQKPWRKPDNCRYG